MEKHGRKVELTRHKNLCVLCDYVTMWLKKKICETNSFNELKL